MSAAQTASVVEKPLTGPDKLRLGLGAAGIIFLFYLFTLVSVLALSVLLVVELGLVVVLARFGLAGVMARAMGEHIAALPVFVRSLWIRKATEFRISLKPADAPELFELMESLCERVHVRVPQTVALEMTSNAWVNLKGYRRGAGRTTLGIGYDLLAGLSDAQIEAVLAHEMMHAKLVQRGFNQLLRGGLNRAIQLARRLSAQVEIARRSRKGADISKGFLNWADWFARKGSKLVAACSRQDEFAADLGATQVSAPGMLQSALLRLRSIGRNAARLPWRERVAQLQSGDGFGDWLRTELIATETTPDTEIKAQLHNQYSTHPSLHDRLAALPKVAPQPARPERPAIQLLADPDKVAQKLIAEIQRLIAQQEQKDSKQLDRWSRKVRSHSHLRTIQSLGVLAIAVGLIGGLITAFVAGVSPGLFEFMTVTIVPGFFCLRFGGYRERVTLPVPDFAVLKAAWQASPTHDQARAKELETALREKAAGRGNNRRKRAQLLAQEAYAALAKCEYLRAHTAANLSLGENNNSVEAAAAFAISAAAIGQIQQMQWALRKLQKTTRFTGPSAGWAAAWIFLLCGQWDRAEALFAEARTGRPDEPTLLALQALCQARRGKLQSAIFSARLSCQPAPRNKEYTKQLIGLLLDAGFLREAQEHLAKVETELRTDPELIFSMLRFKVISRKFGDVAEWEDLYRQHAKTTHSLVRLGALYEMARKPEKAANYFNEAIAAEHFPEALLGLARLEAERKNRQLAERYLLASLNFQKTPGKGGAGALQVLHQAFAQLVMLEEPILNCRAWIASLNGGGGPPALAHHSFMIYAPSRSEAEQRLIKILGAMQPTSPPVLPSAVGWRQASKEQQPDGPVRPGVQGFL